MLRHIGLIALLALGACDEPHSEARDVADASNFKPTSVVLQPAEAARKIDGIATLVSPESLAQLNADLRAAEIAANFSARAFARYKETKTLPEHSIDNAERQASTDSTQVALLKLKLRNTWGDKAPFVSPGPRQQIVDELSSGRTTLVRFDFPRSVETELTNVSVQPLSGGAGTQVSAIWAAPSGSLAMPGSSFFGLMPAGPGLRPGDRARVTAEGEAASAGVVIPASAVVVYAGASWCYVETKPDTFERKLVALSEPVDDGYLVKDFEPGTKVVAQGASVLLSREAEPVGGDDDDDGPVPAKAKAKPRETPVASSDQVSSGAAASDPD